MRVSTNILFLAIVIGAYFQVSPAQAQVLDRSMMVSGGVGFNRVESLNAQINLLVGPDKLPSEGNPTILVAQVKVGLNGMALLAGPAIPFWLYLMIVLKGEDFYSRASTSYMSPGDHLVGGEVSLGIIPAFGINTAVHAGYLKNITSQERKTVGNLGISGGFAIF